MNKRFFFICLIILLFCFPSIIFNVESEISEDEPEPYFYYYPPDNSFGVGVTKSINWSFFRNMFQNHFYKDCNYKRYSYSDWNNGNSYVTIDKTFNNTGYKIDINLDVPVDLYEVNISFGCDIPVLDYVERQGYEIWINYSIENSDEVYQVYFNWSDIANIQGLTINKHYDDVSRIWWISLHRNNVNAGFYSFDPFFGTQTEKSASKQFHNDIIGYRATMGVDSGTADNITVFLGARSNPCSANLTCMLYDDSNTLIGTTEERWLNLTTSDQWYVFNFSGGINLNASEEYNISVWGEGDATTDLVVGYWYNGGNGFYKQDKIYDGSPPDPYAGTLQDADALISIYCSYTVGVASPDWWDNTTYFSSEQPSNMSWENSNSFDFNITMEKLNGTFNWTIQAETGDQSSGNYSTNGSKVLNITSSCGQNITIWVNASANNASNETREWFFINTVNCTPNNPPVLNGESPVNGSVNINRKPDVYVICTDSDSDTMNATFSSNSSGTWKSFASNSSISSGTNITQNFANASAYGTKYWFRVNLSDGEGGFDNETYSFTIVINYPVNFSFENPSNNSYDAGINLTWNITMTDDNGDTFNWTIECNNGNSSSGNDENNGSKTLSIAWLDYFTEYQVFVNATDGNATTNESFNFTTGNITVVTITISGVYPANNSTNIPVQIYIYALFNHTNGSIINISWFHGSEGAENILLGQEINVTNGTYNELYLNATERATDYFFRIQADDGYIWINETFSFKTEGFAGGGKRPNTLWVFAFFGVAIGIMAFFEIKRRKNRYD